jgi:hypothetical protein
MEQPIEHVHRQPQRQPYDTDTSHQVFGNSPTMLALCLSSIGLLKIYAKLQGMTTLIDDGLAVAVIIFLFATVTSYLAIRAATRKRRSKLGRAADAMFLSGLGLAAVLAVVTTYTLAG